MLRARLRNSGREAISNWQRIATEIIFCALCGYLRYHLLYRDVQEMLVARVLKVDPTTAWRGSNPFEEKFVLGWTQTGLYS